MNFRRTDDCVHTMNNPTAMPPTTRPAFSTQMVTSPFCEQQRRVNITRYFVIRVPCHPCTQGWCLESTARGKAWPATSRAESRASDSQRLRLVSSHALGPLSCHELGPLSCHALGPLSCHALGPLSCHAPGPLSCHALGPLSCHALGPLSCHPLGPLSCHAVSCVLVVPSCRPGNMNAGRLQQQQQQQQAAYMVRPSDGQAMRVHQQAHMAMRVHLEPTMAMRVQLELHVPTAACLNHSWGGGSKQPCKLPSSPSRCRPGWPKPLNPSGADSQYPGEGGGSKQPCKLPSSPSRCRPGWPKPLNPSGADSQYPGEGGGSKQPCKLPSSFPS